MLSLVLAKLPDSLTGPAEDGYHGRMPSRSLYAHPDAAASLFRLEKAGGLVYTDIFRGADGQLRAKRAKPASTKAVSFSAHGFGLAVDLDVDATLKRRDWLYPRLLDEMAAAGWYCHRRDRKRGSEDWHMNFLGVHASTLLPMASLSIPGTWDDPVEGRIQQLYGAQLTPGDGDVKTMLAIAGSSDVEAFQASWGLTVDGIAGRNTRRALAYVTAQIDIRTLVA